MRVHDLGWWLLVLSGLSVGFGALGSLMGSTTDWNFIEMVFAAMPGAVNFVYLLVGVSAVWQVWNKVGKK